MGPDMETTQTQPTRCAKHQSSRPFLNRWQRGWDHRRARSKPGKCQLHRDRSDVPGKKDWTSSECTLSSNWQSGKSTSKDPQPKGTHKHTER